MHGNQCSAELPPEHGSLPLPNVVSDSGLLGSLPILATQANCDSHELEVSLFFFRGGGQTKMSWCSLLTERYLRWLS